MSVSKPVPKPVPRRWVVLGLNGAFVTLSRAKAPDPDDVRQAAMALDRQGLVGWLVRMHGDYYAPRKDIKLAMIRLLSSKDGLFDMAEDAFQKRRKELFRRLRQAKIEAPKIVVKTGEFP